MTDAAPQKPILEMEGAQITALRDTATVLLDDVNWSVRPGEFWVVAGPQHSGKSDLLLHAAGLMAPAAGRCRIFDCDTNEFDESHLPLRLRIGYVFAEGKLLNQFTLAENIALPLQYHRNLPTSEITKIVTVLLELLELTPCANATAGNVAIVWRQRAALARALALQPDLLLLDNPNGSLIPRHRRWLVDFLDRLWRGHEICNRRPLTIIVTTDDLHPWQHPDRRFAALHEGHFSELGPWGAATFMRHQAVLELLASAEPDAAPNASRAA